MVRSLLISLLTLTLAYSVANAETLQTDNETDFKTQQVTFSYPGTDAELSGTLTLPASFNADTTPVVLMITGSGLQNRDEEIFGHKPFKTIAEHLANNGIATLRYDDRGFGESTGDAKNATTSDFALDAAGGLRYLRSLNYKRVGVLGHSEGAGICFILGADTLSENRPDFIVALAPPAVPGDSILIFQSDYALDQQGFDERFRKVYCNVIRTIYKAYRTGEMTAALASTDSLITSADFTPYERLILRQTQSTLSNLKSPWIKHFVVYDPAHDIAATTVPALVIYGSLDMQVPPSLNYQLFKRLNPKAKVILYPNKNHLFQTAVTGSINEYQTIAEDISADVLADITYFLTNLPNNQK